MPNYKEIARLKSAGQSNRAIADALGISRNTVNISFEDRECLRQFVANSQVLFFKLRASFNARPEIQ